MTLYATIDDIKAIYRDLTPAEEERATALLPLVCGSLNHEAEMVGKSLPQMVAKDENLKAVAKSVTVDVVARVLMTDTTGEPLTQFSQSALGYSVSGTYLVPGGGLFIKNAELARLGLRRPRYGGFEIYGFTTRHNCKSI